MGKISFTTRFIATILLAAFVAQDIVWANPDALRACGPDRSLQVESGFKPFHLETFFKDSLKKQLKLVLVGTSAKIDDFKEFVVRPLEIPQANGNIVRLKYDFEHKYRRGNNWVVPCIIVCDSVSYKKYFEAEIEADADGSIKFDGTITLSEIAPGAIIEKEAPAPEIYAGDIESYEKKIRSFARRDEVAGLAEYLASLDPSLYPAQCNDVIDAAVACSYDETKRPCRISHATTEAIAIACRKNPALMGVFADRIAAALGKGHYTGTYTLAEIIVRLAHLSFKNDEAGNFMALLAAKLPDEAKLVQALRGSFTENFEITHDKWLPALPPNDVTLENGVVLKEISSNWYLVEHNGAPAGIVEAYNVPGGPMGQLAINVFEPARKAGIGTSIMKWAAGQLKAGDTITRPYPADGSNTRLFLRCLELGMLSSVEIAVSSASDIRSFYDEEPAWKTVSSIEEVDAQRELGKQIFVRGIVSKKPEAGLKAKPEAKSRGISGAEYLRKLGSDLKLMFENILDAIDRIRIRTRNPVLFMQPVGYGAPIPVGFQFPIVMMMAAGKPKQPQVPAQAAARAPGQRTINEPPPDFMASSGGPVEEDSDAEIYPAGVIVRENIAAVIDPVAGPADNVNTPEQVMKILEEGSEMTQIMDMDTGEEKNMPLSRYWALRYSQLLPEDLKGASPHTRIAPLDKALLRQRINNVLLDPAPIAHIMKTIKESPRNIAKPSEGVIGDVRVYVGSKTGYFQVNDANEKFPHQLDIVFIAKGDYPLSDVKPSNRTIQELLSAPGNDVFKKVNVRIVGAESLKKAFMQEEWLGGPRIQERAELQALFVELYRTYFPATGGGITSEDKGQAQKVDKFLSELKIIEKNYAARKVKEVAELSKTIEECKEKKKAIKSEGALAELTAQLQGLRSELEDVEKSIKKCAVLLSDRNKRQFELEGKAIAEERKTYDKMTNNQKINFSAKINAYNEKVRLYNSAKKLDDSKSLPKKRDEYLKAIEEVERDIEQHSSGFMDIERVQNNAYRMREYISQEMEYCIGRERLVPGVVIQNKYMITGTLGSGGFGVVYSANDLTHADMDVQVAIKTAMPVKRPIYDGYLSEIAHTSNKEFHRAPIPQYKNDKGSYGSHLYFAMSLEKGKPLRSILSDIKNGKMELNMQKREVLIHVLSKLIASFHRITTLIHRDLKPENFMIHTTPEGDFVIPDIPEGVESDLRVARSKMPKYLKRRDVDALSNKSCVIDLGISLPGKAVIDENTGKEYIVPDDNVVFETTGTPAYMSPEQGFNDKEKMTDRSDIYSMGVIFYEILTDGCYYLTPLGGETPKGGLQIIMNKKDGTNIWPNDAIKRRRVNKTDIDRLVKINRELPRMLVEAKVIVDKGFKPFKWTDQMSGEALPDMGCRWSQDMVDDEKSLRKQIANIKELDDKKRDEVVRIVVKQKVPDNIAALVMAMLDQEPFNRPDANMVLDELDKILCRIPQDRLAYKAPWTEESRMKKAVLLPAKYPVIVSLIMIAAGALASSGYMLYKANTAAERAAVAVETTQEMDGNTKKAKEGAALWEKKEEEAKKNLEKLTADATAAQASAVQSKAEKARADKEIVALAEEIKRKAAEAEKARIDADSSKKAADQVNKETIALLQKKAALEGEAKGFEDKIKEDAGVG
jgi:serine/threonine protein kinase